jgi:hypothetical protein
VILHRYIARLPLVSCSEADPWGFGISALLQPPLRSGNNCFLDSAGVKRAQSNLMPRTCDSSVWVCARRRTHSYCRPINKVCTSWLILYMPAEFSLLWPHHTSGGVRSQIRSCGICDGQTYDGDNFIRRPLLPVPVLIPLTALHSLTTVSSRRHSADTDSVLM